MAAASEYRVDAALAPARRRQVDVLAEQILPRTRSQESEGILAQVVSIEELRQCVIAVSLDQRIQIEERARDAAQQHALVGNVVDDRTGNREVPDQSANAAKNHFNPDSRENHPQAAAAAIEQQNVSGVCEESRREIDEKKSHLMNFAAEMLARQPVAEFVNGAEPEH